MEVTLTDSGTVWSDTGPQTIYTVSVKAPTGEKVTIANGTTGYIELVTTENATTVKRYYTVDATAEAVIYTTVATEIGSFYTANTPTGEKAFVYNGLFEAAP